MLGRRKIDSQNYSLEGVLEEYDKQRMGKDDIESLAYESRNLFLHQIPLAFVVLIH